MKRLRLRRLRAWLFAGTLLLVQVSLALPQVVQVAEAAKRKRPKKKKQAAEAEPPAQAGNDDILSITDGALGESGGSDGSAPPLDDPEAGLDGSSSAPSEGSAKPAPRGGPAPDAQVALVKPRMRRVAVPPYLGKSAESLRQAVLEVLTEHPDLEVVGSADISMVEKRLNFSAREPGNWPRLATELQLYALVVGDGDASRVRVISDSGRTLGTLTLNPKERLDQQARARLWTELGQYLSDEGMRQHQVNVMRASAEGVLRGQGEELYRQRQIADARAKLRAERLAAASQRAQSRLAQQDAELTHQAQLAQERIRQQQVAAAKAAEEQRQAQLAAQRQAALAAQQQQAALAAQQQQQPPPAAAGYGAPAPAYAAPAPAGGYAPQGGAYGYGYQPANTYPPQGGYGTQPAYGPASTTYPAQPSQPTSSGYSNRGGYVPSTLQPPAAEAPAGDQPPAQ